MKKNGKKMYLPRAALTILIIMLSSMTPLTYGQNPYEDIAYTVEEKNFTETSFGYRYLLFKPKEYSKKSKPFPVLFYLHGAGTYGTELERLKPQVPVKYMVKDGILPFVVVAPLSRYREAWDPDNTHAFVRDILLRNNLDRARVYLTGMSMGGQGTIRLAGDHTRRFAAIAPVAGAGAIGRAKQFKDLPVWAFHGAKDQVIPLRYTSVMMQELKKISNTDVRYTVYPDEGHNIWERAYSTTELYDWFLKQTNPDPIR